MGNTFVRISDLKFFDGTKNCPDSNNIITATTVHNEIYKILNIERIGSSSENGEVFKSCLLDDYNKCTDKFVAVKKIPFDGDINMVFSNTRLGTELICMEMCKILVKNNIVPNLPLMYSYYICDSCTFQNPEIVHRYRRNPPCCYLLNEFATEGDLHNWLRTERTYLDILSCYFQIFAGLYALQIYYNMTHNDLYFSNVLVHSVEKGGHWTYNIDGISYNVPNTGYIFTLWDFEFARIPGLIENNRYLPDQYKNSKLFVNDYKLISNISTFCLEEGDCAELPDSAKNFFEYIKNCAKNNKPLGQVIQEFKYAFDDFNLPEFSNLINTYSFKNLSMDVLFPREITKGLTPEAMQYLYSVSRFGSKIKCRTKHKSKNKTKSKSKNKKRYKRSNICK